MTKKGSKEDMNDKYWKSQIDSQIKGEYKDFLERNGKQASPDSAHLFATEKINNSGGFHYMEYDARALILLLEGKLPPFFD